LSSGLWRRLLSGNELRKTRFHDEKGNPVGWDALLHAPLALATAAGRLAGLRPVLPMISFRAARVIDGLLTPDSRVVEFGSGYSTLWFAQRCAELVSIEDDPYWRLVVQELLTKSGLHHVRHEYRGLDRYSRLDDYPDGYFDFALVDGKDRTACVRTALAKVKPGGWVYLDNSDKDMTIPDGDLRRAEALLVAAIGRRDGSLRYFTDFSPTNFFAEQGLLARL
jgi:hypothetical protein